MPWNGSGVFNRIYSWVSDAAAGINITASRVDNDTNDIVANGLDNCLTRDGQGSATANLPMNGQRHTGAGPAVGSGDYVILSQLGGTNGSIPQFSTEGGYQALGTDANGFQFRAVAATYSVGIRTDNVNGYLSDSATPTGVPSAHEPFAWALSTGAVTIDGTGAGASTGGVLTLGTPGTSGNEAVAFSQFGASLGSPGHASLPSGWIIKMGSCVTTISGIAVTFDTPFPNTCVSVALGSLNSNPIFATCQTVTASGFICQTWNAAASGAQIGSATVTYIATGF